MNLALAIGTLLLGQMIDPNFNPTRPPSDQVVPPLERLEQAPVARPEARGSRPGPGRSDSSSGPSRLGGGLRSRAGGDRQGTSQEGYVPLAPTDPLLSSPNSPWTPPTEGSSSAPFSFGTPLGTASPSGAAPPPAKRGSLSSRAMRTTPPTARQFANLAATRQAQAARVEALSAPVSAPRPITKPFSNYQAPPTLSPYLNMYRANQGQVENYTQLVRPELQQRQQNQILGGEIRGLQSTTRVQGRVLQRLGKQQTQPQQAPLAPEYFNNYQQYYPLLSR